MDQMSRDEDLIDFQLIESLETHARLAEPPRQLCTSPLITSEDNVSEHLLDFELPVLEETLSQSSLSRRKQNCEQNNVDGTELDTQRRQVDIDQVLISIDNEVHAEENATHHRGSKRKDSNSSTSSRKSRRNDIVLQVFESATKPGSQLEIDRQNSEPKETQLNMFDDVELDPLYDRKCSPGKGEALDLLASFEETDLENRTELDRFQRPFDQNLDFLNNQIQKETNHGAEKPMGSEKPLHFQLGPHADSNANVRHNQYSISPGSDGRKRFPESLPYPTARNAEGLQKVSRQRSVSESQQDQEDAFHQDGTPCRSMSCDNMVALGVLMKLDELLDKELKNSGSKCNCNEVEDCLYELDNYLREFDDSSGSASSSVTDLDCSSAHQGDREADDFGVDASTSDRKSRRVGGDGRTMSGCDNDSYVDTEAGFADGVEFRRRSSLGRPAVPRSNERNSGILVRQHPYRATVGPPPYRIRERALAALGRCEAHRSTVACRRDRPRSAQPLQALLTTTPSTATHRLQLPAGAGTGPATAPYDNGRTSARKATAGSGNANATESDEDIDWSWVHDVDRDARTAGMGPQETARDTAGRTSASPKPTNNENSPQSNRAGSSWLRTSMRRIRHIRLPSDTSAAAALPAVVTSHPVGVANTMPPLGHQPVATPPADNYHPQQHHNLQGSLRPVSAPSRLAVPQAVPAANPVGNGSAVNGSASAGRARSRSRDSRVSGEPGGRARSSSASSRSRRARSLSSSESSLASSVDSVPGVTAARRGNGEAGIPNGDDAGNIVGNGTGNRRTCDRPRQNDMPQAQSPLGQWPHGFSSMFACLGCTIGLFNISRFALLSVHFGANFMLQFLLLSLVVGMPLFTLQLCLGQQLGAGVIDMWRISPLFQGVGVALLAAQALTGLYSIIGVSWMFIYFSDSFITKLDRYRWAEPFDYYRDEEMKASVNGTFRLAETVPAYLSGVVFQRHHLSSGSYFGTIKFQVAFNLAVVWMIVFVSLSKGLRSYGKVVYVFTLLPIFGTFILCAKMLGMMPAESINVIFPETSWSEFFLNTQSWISACQETFLTWGLMGAAAMQIASHNKNKHLLQRDSRIVCVITLIILLLVAFLANTCIEILKHNGYNYVPDSFERISTYVFLRPLKEPLPPSLAATPFRFMTHTSFILGERVTRPGIDPATESGYQVLRLATEIVPTTLAILGSDQVSPFWAVLFYFILILFGIAQQLAIWHCVITGIMAIKAKVLKSWETTITFFSCAAGFVLGLPMTTEMGIYVVYFLDCTVGGIWWLVLVVLMQVVAVFMVRGRPYSGDTVVTALFPTNSPRPCYIGWAPHMLSFIWNVILPVVLMVFCVVFFKNGNFRELFIWHHVPSADYWPLWARQIGALLQLLPILCIPMVAIVQSYRYLNNGPSDIFERIQLLYRPPLNSEHMEDLTAIQQAAAAAIGSGGATTPAVVAEDPPPKYTPPPSYTTATGARIAKLFRQSFRRSVRRIANALGEGSSARQRSVPPLGAAGMTQQPPPPDYAAVLVEMSQPHITISVPSEVESSSTVLDSEDQRMSTIERRASRGPLTAADVASILRASFRRSTIRTVRRSAASTTTVTVDSGGGSLSAECLVDGAEPIGESSIVALGDLSLTDPEIKITD